MYGIIKHVVNKFFRQRIYRRILNEIQENKHKDAYDPDQEYVGPYVYKDGSSTVVTYDYSNADYDYFNQEYYTAVKNQKNANITTLTMMKPREP